MSPHARLDRTALFAHPRERTRQHKLLVPNVGLEPTPSCEDRILSPALTSRGVKDTHHKVGWRGNGCPSHLQIHEAPSFAITGLVEFRMAQKCDCAKLERPHLRRS